MNNEYPDKYTTIGLEITYYYRKKQDIRRKRLRKNRKKRNFSGSSGGYWDSARHFIGNVVQNSG